MPVFFLLIYRSSLFISIFSHSHLPFILSIVFSDEWQIFNFSGNSIYQSCPLWLVLFLYLSRTLGQPQGLKDTLLSIRSLTLWPSTFRPTVKLALIFVLAWVGGQDMFLSIQLFNWKLKNILKKIHPFSTAFMWYFFINWVTRYVYGLSVQFSVIYFCFSTVLH